MAIRVLDPFTGMCPFCLDAIRRGAPEDGKCGHERLLNAYPHLRLNAADHLGEAALRDSKQRFAAAQQS
jgi:hypothetical protein